MQASRIIRTPLVSLCWIALLSACSPGDPPQVEPPAPVAPVVVAVPVPEADLLIQGGILLDMVTDEPNPRQVKAIVIRDGKIDSIIAADSTEALPPATRTINAGTNYILPGLIDSHVHFRPFVPDASIWRRLSLYYGVTTLFDTGPCGETCEETGQDANPWIKEYKDFMNSSATNGPTLYVTGKRFDGPAEGGHPLAVKVSNQAEIAQYLDFLVGFGADGVKVEKTLPADLRTLVMQEANARGLPVVGHSKDARESIAAGMKFIEHMWPIVSSLMSGEPPKEELASPLHDRLMDLDKAPELIKLMVDNGVYLNPTMVGRYGYFADGISEGAIEDEKNMQFGGLFSDMPENNKAEVLKWWNQGKELKADTLATYEAGLGMVQAFIKLFSEAGGKVLAATDAGQEKLVGISLHREMKMLVDAGITPYRALLGATRWPSEMMYKDKLIGTIEAGKQADIVIIAANPAENISATKEILYVVRKGSVQRTPQDCSTVFPPISMSCSKN